MTTIKLNIGGTTMDVLQSTLDRSEMLKSMFNDVKYNNESIFFDEDPIIFKHMLNYLRNPKYPFPSKYYYILDHYLIDYDVKLSNTIIKLNVQGIPFEISNYILDKSVILKNMINNDDGKNPIFIDEDPIIFQHILNYLRNSKYPFPNKYYYILDHYSIFYAKQSKNIIKLNVTGTPFEISYIMINECDGLKKMIDDSYDGLNSIFIDEDPIIFNHILNFIRDPMYDFPATYYYRISLYLDIRYCLFCRNKYSASGMCHDHAKTCNHVIYYNKQNGKKNYCTNQKNICSQHNIT